MKATSPNRARLPEIDPQTPISEVFSATPFPAEFPLDEKDFAREDPTSDRTFYKKPRQCYYVDHHALNSLTEYYAQILEDGQAVLDLCSSWVSHYPPSFQPSRAAGVGMNSAELARNTQLTEYTTKDLNEDPTLPYDSDSFDIVTLVVSVAYLTSPLNVFREIHRVLKPNGRAIISQSDRCFPSKAIDIWLRTNDPEHAFIIGAYFHYAGGFVELEGLDLSPHPGQSDPLFVVQARKLVVK